MRKLLVLFCVFFSFFSFFNFSEKAEASFFSKFKISVEKWKSPEALEREILGNIDSSHTSIDSKAEPISVFKKARNFIISFVYIITIWVLVWIGIRIASARGNPEEFKKAWMHLVYVIIWIFIIVASWGIVKAISSLNLFS